MRCVVLSIVSVLTAAPVLAADLYTSAPLRAPIITTSAAYSWAGFYAGVYGAYLDGQTSSRNVASGVVTNVATRGGAVGVTVGGNVQQDQFVAGVEADIGWSGAKGETACVLLPTSQCSADIRWTGSLRGRIGLAHEQVLVYGTAGLAVAEGVGTTTPALAGTDGIYSAGFVGWTAGLGAEMKVTQAVSIKAEYSYTDFGTRTAPVGALGNQAYNITAKSHAGKLGVNFHF